MECPNCKHAASNTALLQCSHCGEAFERGPFEEYQHLEYLVEWLKDRSEISFFQRKELLTVVEKKRDKLLTQLLPKTVEKEEPADVKPAPAPVVTTPLPPTQPTVAPAPIETPKPEKSVDAKPAPVVPPPVTAKPAVVSAPKATVAPASSVVTPKPVAPPKPKPAPKPVAPPKPKRPPVDWKKVREQIADAVTSGALLRALLYLGAFMIVVSATVLVVRFWNQFNPLLQMVFIASVPLMFYAGGWALRTRLKLVQGGTVLTGIGAILVAVDFAAVYQFGGVAEQVNGPVYWLFVAVFCTALYAFTTSRIKGEFFDYLTLVSGASILVALTRVPKPAPALEWTVVTVTFSGMLMTYLAGRFLRKTDAWHDLARASRYLSQILIPASVFYVIFSLHDLPILTSFAFATVGYIVLAWKFPSIVFAYSALAASLGGVIFGLRGADVPAEWYPLAASVLALVYILISQGFARDKSSTTITQNYNKALNTTGLTLIAAGAVSGFIFAFSDVWAGVLAMFVATLDLIVCAYIYKQSRYTLLTSSLLVAPFTFSFWKWFMDADLAQPFGWLTVAWGGLALTYVLIATFLQNAERHARWIHLLSQLLVPLALFALPFEYLSTLGKWSYIPVSTTLGLSVVFYLISTRLTNTNNHPALTKLVDWLPLRLKKSVFLWFAGFLFPLWIAVGWYGTSLNGMWFGALLTGFGIAYIGIGQWLVKRIAELRLSLHSYSYLLLTIGIFLARPDGYPLEVADRLPLLIALTVAFVSLIVLAITYNRVIETTLASLMFIWVFVLSLDMLKVPAQAHGFAFILLAGLGYVPVAMRLNRLQIARERKHPTLIFVIGYLLSLYALSNSLYWTNLGRSLPWVGAVVPFIAGALYTVSTSYFKDNKEISSLFAWSSVITFAIAFRQSLTFFESPSHYDAFAWTAFAVVYMLVERWLARIPEADTSKIKRYWFDQFHMPLLTGWIVIALIGLYLTLPVTLSAFNGRKLVLYIPALLAQITIILLLITSASLYRSRIPLFIEPFLAFLPTTLFFIGYGEKLFGTQLATPQYALAWTGLGITHILAAVFTDRAKVRYSHGLYLGGYAVLSWAVIWSLTDHPTLMWTLGLWILTSIASALLVHFGRHHTWDDSIRSLFTEEINTARTFAHNIFQWLAAWTFPIWCVIFLRELNVPDSFSWLGISVPPLAYLALALWTRRINSSYASPLHSAAHIFTVVGLLVTIPETANFLFNSTLPDHGNTILLAFIIMQTTGVVFYAASAWIFASRAFTHIAAWLSIVTVSMAWQAYDPDFTYVRFAYPWLIWSFILLGIGFALDKNKIRYSHALYLAGYVLASVSVLWSVFERPILVWTFGTWILFAVVSALIVHFGRHHTWDDLVRSFFGETNNNLQTVFRNFFQWLAAWTFPIWTVILLFELGTSDFAWLGLVVPPLAYLALVLWTRRIDSSYASPLFTSAQFFTIIGLLISVPATYNFLLYFDKPSGENALLAFIILQSITVVFYAASAWMRSSRFFSHIATWLSIIAFTMAWKVYGVAFTPVRLVIPWFIWSAVLLFIGFALDKNKTRYSHGPYLGAYALTTYALIRSTENNLTNIYALVITIMFALASHLVIHYGRHHSFEDFINRFWSQVDETSRNIVSTIFLFYAAYAFPVLLTQYLARIHLDLPWRGVTLAITAPLYIAIGLWIRNTKSRTLTTVPTWALYSAGYALTAIGAMISFGDQRLAIYVLGLNAIVYAASAYIFSQPFWLYLTTVLAPIITILALHYNGRLETNIVAWSFMGFAFLYLAIGQLFDRMGKVSAQGEIHPCAAPFYAPGFLLSAVSLALASNNRELAIPVYSAGVILYALSSLLFKETWLIYPAAWLAAVPYYLAITLTSLETQWYGLAWLPLIVLYIALGRFVFHNDKLAPIGQGMLAQWLTHPAVPFYILAYGLSISMISLSYASPLPLTIAFGSAAVIYFASAYLFKKPAWIYPALFAIHMTVLAYFTINPQGGPMRHITIPFLAMTWITSLIGYIFEHNTQLTDENKTYRFSFLNRLFGHAWARPFFIFAIIEMVIWQSLALTGTDTTIIVGGGYALLFALFSILWAEGALVYGAVAFGLLAVGGSLKQAELKFENAVAVYGGIGFGLYLLGRLMDALSARIKSLTVWLTPLTHWSIALTGAAVIINLPEVTNHMTATAATFAFAGALYTAIAYRGRLYRLGYLGMALLELSWVMALIMNDVTQPQWYAIPGGLYFIGLGYMEWVRSKSKYAVGLELLGLGVLLVTSFAQSLDGETGLPYFVLLLFEGLVVIWWGVYQKRKIPFFTGIAATAINVVAQVIVLVNVYDINRWFVGFGVGLLIMSMAIYIERSRERLRERARELSDTIEKWE
ncbi:MAG TPA: hypothetical protein VLA72_17870 [Anaerolineales bacterium]|nr:hypothetical protein [Anaerolineales bacterium]